MLEYDIDEFNEIQIYGEYSLIRFSCLEKLLSLPLIRIDEWNESDNKCKQKEGGGKEKNRCENPFLKFRG